MLNNVDILKDRNADYASAGERNISSLPVAALSLIQRKTLQNLFQKNEEARCQVIMA